MRPLWIAGGWAILAGIVYLSLTPSPPSADFESSDKVGHLFSYGVLMAWFSLLYAKKRPLLAGAFIALGIALEFAQGATGYRTFEVADMVANSLGVLLGWGGVLLYRRMVR